jgi:hypothetical protein
MEEIFEKVHFSMIERVSARGKFTGRWEDSNEVGRILMMGVGGGHQL